MLSSNQRLIIGLGLLIFWFVGLMSFGIVRANKETKNKNVTNQIVISNDITISTFDYEGHDYLLCKENGYAPSTIHSASCKLCTTGK